MCTIEKLNIQGIRSFNPSKPQGLDFDKPLTLIVGHNGAGKTTIIECLKLACCGELPPNTKSGQSFIHDPKVAGESEVRGQVKLRLNAWDQPLIITRSYQLTQKKTSMQFKTLDTSLRTIDKDTKQHQTTSYKCAEVDQIVSEKMCIDKAVMENVIFVHQEDSNWPLSEGAVLKKKFDDIFAATKYTKAVEAFRKLKNEKTQALREAKMNLTHLSSQKNAATRLKEDIKECEDKQASYEKEIADLGVEIEAAEQEEKNYDALIKTFQRIDRDLAEKRALYESGIRRNEEQRKQLEDLYGEADLDQSIEDLEEFHKALAPALEAAINEANTIGQDIKAAEGKEEALKRQYTNDQGRAAQLSAQADAHAQNIIDRDQALVSAASDTEMEPFPNSKLSQNDVRRFMEAFGNKVRSETENLQEQKAKAQQQDDESGRSVDEITRQITDASQIGKHKQQTLKDNEKRIGQLQNQIESATVSDEMAKEAEQSEKDTQKKFESKQRAFNQQNFEKDLENIRSATDVIQRKISALRQERDKLSVAADDGARFTVLKRERHQKQTQIDTLLSHRKQRINQLLQSVELPPPGSLKQKLDQILSENSSALKDAQSELQRAQGKANTTQGSLSACTRLLDQQRQEASSIKASLESSMRSLYDEDKDISRLESLVAEEETVLNRDKSKLERVNTLRINSKTWKTVAEKKNCCEVCNRAFKGNEMQEFLDLVDRKMGKLPSLIETMKSELEALEAKLSSLRQLLPDAARLTSLQNSVIPSSEEKQVGLEKQSSEEATQASTLHEEVRKLSQKEQELQQLKTEVVWPVDRLASDVSQLSKDITRLENQMQIAGGTRTVADVDGELEQLDSEKSEKERARDELLRKQSRLRDEVSRLQNAWYAAKEEATTFKNQAEKRSGLQQEIVDLTESNEQLKQQIEANNNSVQPLRARREELSRTRRERRNAARERETDAENKVRHLSTLQSKLEDRCRVVNNYDQSGKAQRLQEVKQALQKASKTLADQTEKVKALKADKEAKEVHLRSEKDQKKQIEDHLMYAREVLKVKSLREEVNRLQGEFRGHGDMEKIKEGHQNASNLIKGLSKKENFAQGGLVNVKVSKQKFERDLKDKAYDTIDKDWSETNTLVRCLTLAIVDLEHYNKALEKALLIFHSRKMASINEALKENWQKTYRGQDIDFIQIKADADGARSYNYRVVMYTPGGAELDMRGRCSAGQKVLACILIRLALSESFCTSCGILALDEPTTNLDTANSASLAEALRNLLELRKDQPHFQLVIITHDEDFAQSLGTKEYTAIRHRITKDENQHTRIDKEEVDE